MAYFRRTVLALALAGTGLVGTTGAAFATEDHHDGDSQTGIANVDDTQTIVPTNVCGNNVPVNVAGIQVPIQDVAPNVPVGSGSEDGGGNAAGIEKSCGNDVDASS